MSTSKAYELGGATAAHARAHGNEGRPEEMQGRRVEAGRHDEDLESLEWRLDSLRRRANDAERGARVAALHRQLGQTQMALERCRQAGFSRELRGLLVAKVRLVEAELASLLERR
jgi:hypothetical protein